VPDRALRAYPAAPTSKAGLYYGDARCDAEKPLR